MLLIGLLTMWRIVTLTTGNVKTITLGASLSSEFQQSHYHIGVKALNDRVAKDPSLVNIVRFNGTSILMDGNPIRSALDVCDRLMTQQVHVVIVAHPNSSYQPPISVSYTCGYYNIPVIGVSARDSAFSDNVSNGLLKFYDFELCEGHFVHLRNVKDLL